MAPLLPMCLLCGRQFGMASLEIHMRTCEQKYEQEHGKRAPPAPAVPLTVGGRAAALEAQNEAAFSTFQQEVLEPCPHCARTFLPDRLVVHLRSCRGDVRRASIGSTSSHRTPRDQPIPQRPSTSHGTSDHGESERRSSAPPPRLQRKSSGSSPSSAPLLPMCHLCGRQFGTASLEIHMRTCEQKYEQEHGKRAPPAPAVPRTVGGRAAALEAQNEAAFSTFQQEVLEPCPHCARTFLLDRLAVHLRSCKGDARHVPVSSISRHRH
jgi:hypothetical protein